LNRLKRLFKKTLKELKKIKSDFVELCNW